MANQHHLPLLQNEEIPGQQGAMPTMIQSAPHYAANPYPANAYPTGQSVVSPHDPSKQQGEQVATQPPEDMPLHVGEIPMMVQSTPQYHVNTYTANTYSTGHSVMPPPNPQGPYTHQGEPVTTQPSATGTDVVTVSPEAPPERPNHGLAVGSLVFAIMTLFCTCGCSLLCSVPAIIFSSVALAQDYKVDQAKKLSIASLMFTIAFYACVAIVVVIFVIIYAVQGPVAFRTLPKEFYDDYDLQIPKITHVDIPELDDIHISSIFG